LVVSDFTSIRLLVDKAINEKLAIQHPNELHALLARVKELEPKIVLEIGSAQGGTWYALARVAQPNALLISVDLPSDHHMSPDWAASIGMAPNYERVTTDAEALRRRLQNMALPEQTAIVIQGDSTTSKIRLAVQEAVAGRSIDFALIDGGHDYRTVRADFKNYGPLVREGGLIAFHDIVTTGADVGSGAAIGVPKLWSEIMTVIPGSCREYVALGSPCGIGVIRMNAAVEEMIQSL
jgi:predicted O-methyltransferase YrrM